METGAGAAVLIGQRSGMGRESSHAFTGHVNKTVGIHGDAIGGIQAGAAVIRRVAQHRINHEGQAVIVRRDFKPHRLRVGQPIAARDFLTNALNILIDQGLGLPNLIRTQAQNQVALWVQGHLVRTSESNGDHGRVHAGTNHKIVFQVLLVAVVDQTDARIKVRHAHARKRRHARPPAGRVVAEQIIHAAGQFVFAGGAGRCIRPHELEPELAVTRRSRSRALQGRTARPGRRPV